MALSLLLAALGPAAVELLLVRLELREINLIRPELKAEARPS